MACPLLWTSPTDNRAYSMTTIILLDFASSQDPEGRPLGKAVKVWNRVLSCFSKLRGWESTKWGPLSDDKPGTIVVIGARGNLHPASSGWLTLTVWNFLKPPPDFPFSPKEPLSRSSPLRPLTDLLKSKPRLLNAPLFPAPRTPHYLLGAGTFELELLYLPPDACLYRDLTFSCLFSAMSVFLESQINRFDTPPWDFHSGHRGWLFDEESLDSVPVHVIILHYSSLEGERRFKDPAIAHEGMSPYQDRPESLYQRLYLDKLAGLALYGVRRESVHFRLNLWKPDRVSLIQRYGQLCTIQ
ncbi:MAG: hypothetical protein Q9226_000742 [Calogaya cf. arnoldii]